MRSFIIFSVLAILLWTSTGLAEAPRMDVLFLLDSTGSMSDEIDAVKGHIRDMISEIASGNPTPDVRFGIVTYRDRGDDYITKTFELTRDIDQILTPGTVIEDGVLWAGESNYIVAVSLRGETAGIAVAEASTGEFTGTEVAEDQIAAELERWSPREVVALSRVWSCFRAAVNNLWSRGSN